MEEARENAGAGAGVAELLGRSRKDLLDLTLRNPLLAFRPLKAKGAEVVDELPREVFRILVAEEKAMYFQPGAEPSRETPLGSEGEPARERIAQTDDMAVSADDPPPELLEIIAEADPSDAGPADRHVDNRLQTAHNRVRLEVRLRNTMRHAASSIEEQGVNILYLALGMLRWYESDSSEVARAAPLVLVPVELSRGSARARFKLRWTGEEVGANLSLASKLVTDFGVHLPEFEDDEELDVSEYFRQVGEAVATMDRWAVDDQAAHLGFFSFSKLLIYQDLDPAVWPEEEAPQDHPVVDALYRSAGFPEDPPSVPDEGNLDDHVAVADIHNVLDSDSSQNLAIVDAQDGRNLVVQGPPGTGKSQMITNLVAEAVARGKTVLFVAEKMAALQVVKRRLDTVHVGDACLELHSHTANKRMVLDELKRTMKLGEPRLADAAADTALLEERRKRLNAYSRAVNEPVGESGLSPNALIGKLALTQAAAEEALQAGEGEGQRTGDAQRAGEPDEQWPRVEVADASSWSRERFVLARETVREAQDLVATIGVPREHVYWGSRRRQYLPTDERALADGLAATSSALRQLRIDAAALCEVGGIEAAQDGSSVARIQALVDAARRALDAPDLRGADHRSRAWTAQADRIRKMIDQVRELKALRSRHATTLIPDAWDANVLSCRQALAATGDKWWRVLSGSYRRARAELRGLCASDLPGSARAQLALVDDILRAKRLRDSIATDQELAAQLFPGSAPTGLHLGTARDVDRWHGLCEPAEWLLDLHGDMKSGAVQPVALDLLTALAERTALETAETACRNSASALAEALAALSEKLEWDPARFAPDPDPLAGTFQQLAHWLDAAARRPSALQDVVRFNQIAARLEDDGLTSIAEAAASWTGAGERLVRLYECRFFRAWLERAFQERPVLAEFDGTTHEGVVERFRQMDVDRLRHNQALVAKLHWERVPRGHGGGQLAVLRREFEKKRRHLPLRRLMIEAGNAIQAIKPVFMMSPLSIAKFVPPGSLRFDMVIFDEASQVRPVEAMGAIMRGRQTVVVGDSKQLPPTTFFDRMSEEDDGEASSTADLESILGMFCAQGAPQRMLRWHYRSRHESLIAVSNHEFYDNALVVFPSPDRGREDTGVLFRHAPETHYLRGRGGRVNPGEAQVVAQAVMEHAAARPKLTLGVAAFSLGQARRIEDELEILRRRDPSAEAFFRSHPQEPFFVKNLENVQGDERDVILISVGYGKTEGGHLPMNFGPLNRDRGERRLNVLITRARRRCVVHSNFVADDLDLRRSGARGVDALKTYLKYAETGRLGIAKATGQESDSPFEDAVAAELRAKGHDVEHQVGSAGFRIDLAVVDPNRPGRYLLGIECDGAAYHSARSARDRDRLRQQVLEGLGWTIHRIWSTDWFRHRDREVAKTEKAIRRAALLSNGGSASERGGRGGGAHGGGGGPTEASGADVSSPSGPQGADHVEQAASPRQSGKRGLARAEPFSIEKREVVAAAPYRLAEPVVRLAGWEFHDVPSATVLDWVVEVVEVESPVHEDEAAARVAAAADLQRVGSRIRNRVASAVRLGVGNGLLVRRGPFLWRPGHDEPAVRNRGELPAAHKLRAPAMIAPEEIAAALRQVIEASYGISRDDAVAEACRLMGFRRKGAKLAKAFAKVLDQRVQAGELELRGAFLHLPSGRQ